MTDAVNHTDSTPRAENRSVRATVKPRLSILEKLTSDELHTLRLDDRSRAEFDAFVQRFTRSRAELKVFEGEDVESMDDARYDRRSAAEAEQYRNGMAVVHFMAPHILKLRDGAAKRKWRSFLTKLRKDENLN